MKSRCSRAFDRLAIIAYYFLNIVYIFIELRNQRVPNYCSSTSYRVPHVVGVKTRDIYFQFLPKLISLDVILVLNIADIASGVRLLWILYISLAKLILYIKAKEDQLASLFHNICIRYLPR